MLCWLPTFSATHYSVFGWILWTTWTAYICTSLFDECYSYVMCGNSETDSAPPIFRRRFSPFFMFIQSIFGVFGTIAQYLICVFSHRKCVGKKRRYCHTTVGINFGMCTNMHVISIERTTVWTAHNVIIFEFFAFFFAENRVNRKQLCTSDADKQIAHLHEQWTWTIPVAIVVFNLTHEFCINFGSTSGNVNVYIYVRCTYGKENAMTCHNQRRFNVNSVLFTRSILYRVHSSFIIIRI